MLFMCCRQKTNFHFPLGLLGQADIRLKLFIVDTEMHFYSLLYKPTFQTKYLNLEPVQAFIYILQMLNLAIGAVIYVVKRNSVTLKL